MRGGVGASQEFQGKNLLTGRTDEVNTLLTDRQNPNDGLLTPLAIRKSTMGKLRESHAKV